MGIIRETRARLWRKEREREESKEEEEDERKEAEDERMVATHGGRGKAQR